MGPEHEPRRPGRQVQRQQRGRRIGFAVCSAGAVLCLVAAVWTIAGLRDEPGLAAIVGSFAGAGALLLGGGAWLLWRRIRPLAPQHLAFEVTAGEARRGGRIEATVTRTAPPPAGTELEIALVCTEFYDVKVRVHNPDGADYDSRQTRDHELHRQSIAVGETTTEAAFEVPAEAPFSYDGECVSAVWTVRALERRPGRRDRHRDEPVWVLP